MPLVEYGEDVHQETMSSGALVTVHVENHDFMLDRNSRRPFRALQLRNTAGRAGAEEARVMEGSTRVDFLGSIREMPDPNR